jgi:alpha-galactosidase
MPNPKKPASMDRREFLQFAGSGLLFSMLDPLTAKAGTPEDATVVSAAFSLVLHFTPGGGAVQISSLRNSKTGFEWVRTRTPLEPVFAATGEPSQKWTSSRPTAEHRADGDRFELASQTEDGTIRSNLALQPVSGNPILEIDSEFQNASKAPIAGVTAFGPLRFALRNDLGPLVVHAVRRNEYALESIPVNGPVNLSGGRWNAPEYGGLLLLEAVGKEEFLLVGIEWERGWRYRIEKDANGTWLSVDVSDLTYDMAPGERLPAPRMFLGVSHGDVQQAFLTTRHYMQQNVFPSPLQNSPWIVYDFWATEAEGVEEAAIHEVEFAASLGVDVFNMDASWYVDSSKKGTGDWGCGLGHYADDRAKYPMGLASISHRVHEAGMKFGLWVGPNVVDSRIVGTAIPKLWIAQVDGKDQTLQPAGWESPVSQVCLGCHEYLDYLKKELTRIVREFQLDWLKWDNSGIPASPANCTRADHGHQAGDGSYAALVGQYEIFDHLHATFPDLVLEQCGYGSRLDYGLARTIRSNWLSDASYPSNHVRNNALIASYLYPSSYNGAWIVSEDDDLKRYANDPAMLDTIFRSRMMSLFGFGTINGQLKERVSLYPEPVLTAARRNVELYKRYRHLLQHDCQPLLKPVDTKKGEGGWLAVEFASPTGQEAVILAFRAESPQESVQLTLRALQADANYDVHFANGNRSDLKVKGGNLLSKGISILLEKTHMSEVILLRMS